MTLKRRGRVSFGAAMAVLVALVALALLSRVDAQFDDRLASLRDRVAVALESFSDLVDEEGVVDLDHDLPYIYGDALTGTEDGGYECDLLCTLKEEVNVRRSRFIGDGSQGVPDLDWLIFRWSADRLIG